MKKILKYFSGFIKLEVSLKKSGSPRFARDDGAWRAGARSPVDLEGGGNLRQKTLAHPVAPPPPPPPCFKLVLLSFFEITPADMLRFKENLCRPLKL